MSIRLHKRNFNISNLPKKIKSCFSDLDVIQGKKIINNETKHIIKNTQSYEEMNETFRTNYYKMKKKNDQFQKGINRYKKFYDFKKFNSKGEFISNFEKYFQDLILYYKIKGYKIPDLTTGRHNLFKPSSLCTSKRDINTFFRNQTFLNGFIENNEDKSVIYLKKLRKNIHEKIEENKRKRKEKEMGINNDIRLLKTNEENQTQNNNINENNEIQTNHTAETTIIDKLNNEIEDLENYNKNIQRLIKSESMVKGKKRQSFMTSKLKTYINLYYNPNGRRKSSLANLIRNSFRFSSVAPSNHKLNFCLNSPKNLKELNNHMVDLKKIHFDEKHLNNTVEEKNVSPNKEKLLYKSYEDIKMFKLNKLFKTAMSSPNIRDDNSYFNDLEKYFKEYKGIKKEQMDKMKKEECESKDIMKYTNALQRKINFDMADKYRNNYIREKKFDRIKEKLKKMNYLDKEICKLDRYYIKGLNGFSKERVIESN